jgi:hypothetical protein
MLHNQKSFLYAQIAKSEDFAGNLSASCLTADRQDVCAGIPHYFVGCDNFDFSSYLNPGSCFWV